MLGKKSAPVIPGKPFHDAAPASDWPSPWAERMYDALMQSPMVRDIKRAMLEGKPPGLTPVVGVVVDDEPPQVLTLERIRDTAQAAERRSAIRPDMLKVLE